MLVAGFYGAQAQIDFKPATWERISTTDVRGKVVNESGDLNQINVSAMHVDWPTDSRGQAKKVALIEIHYKGFPAEELDNLKVITSPVDPDRVVVNSAGMTANVFVPLNVKEIIIQSIKYKDAEFVIPENLADHTVYSVDVEMQQLHTVMVSPAVNPGTKVTVALIRADQDATSAGNTSDQWGVREVPAKFENVPNGQYELTVRNNGRAHNVTVMVNNLNTNFTAENTAQLDLRTRKKISLISPNSPNVSFYVNDRLSGTGSKVDVELPYGSYTVEAKAGNLGATKNITVGDDSDNIIYLSPQAMKTIEIVGMYNGRQVDTEVYTDKNVPEIGGKGSKAVHKYTLPTDGTEYAFTLSYGGSKAHKNIRFKPGMATDYKVKISGDRSMSLVEYSNDKWGWDFDYVTKQIKVTTELESGETQSISTNGVWDDGFGCWLKGFSTGFHFKPAFNFGLGLYTGLSMEFYFSAGSEPIDDYDKYFEMDLSIPLHVMYQFAFSNKIAVGFHTGPSFNYAIYGTYYNTESIFEDSDSYGEDKFFDDFWGTEPWPKRVNWAWDFGLFARFGPISIHGMLSYGMNDLGCYPDFGEKPKSVMHKRSVGLSIAF